VSEIRLGLSTGSLYPLPNRIERTFALAAENRLDGVEVLCDALPVGRNYDALGDLAATYGVPVFSLHAPFASVPSLDGWGRGPVAYITQAVRLAEELGAAHVVTHVPRRLWFPRCLGVKLPLPLPSPRGAAQYRWMARGGLRALQATTAVKVCLESMPRQPLPASWSFRWNTLATWPESHEHLALDTTHWGTLGVPPVEAYRVAREQIRHVHISNYVNGRQHRLPQAGELDLRALLREMANDGFGGLVVIELALDALASPDDGAITANLAATVAFCRKHLAAPDA
jgi:sugar phosphate isomerase/epimerase